MFVLQQGLFGRRNQFKTIFEATSKMELRSFLRRKKTLPSNLRVVTHTRHGATAVTYNMQNFVRV